MDMVDKQDSTMKPNMEEILRQRRLTFIGKVLAEFPADCRNHLAVIQESADWLGERFLEQTGHEAREYQEKFGEILSTIIRHVKILYQKNYYLDRFARRIGTISFTPDPAENAEGFGPRSRRAQGRRIEKIRQPERNEERGHKAPARPSGSGANRRSHRWPGRTPALA